MARTVSCALATTKKEVSKEPSTNSKILGRGVASVAVVARIESARNLFPFSFDDGMIHEITYKESAPYQLCSRFLADPDRYMNALFEDDLLFRKTDGES